MSIKIASALTLGIVVLAGGALFFWPDLDDEPQASAQEVVESACAKAVATDYFDLAVHMEATEGGMESDYGYTAKVGVAGVDFQLEVRGFIDRPMHADGIYVGGKGYTREADGVWQVEPAASTTLLALFGATPTADGWSICPDLAKAEKGGTEVVQGSPATRYTVSVSIDALPNSAKEHIVHTQWDVWVDETGQLVQVRRTETHPTEPTTITTQTTVISGVGETNVITAPVVP